MKQVICAAFTGLISVGLALNANAFDNGDECYLGEKSGSNECRLWDYSAEEWVTVDDGAGNLHNRARNYTAWIREELLAAGGVLPAVFTNSSYTTLAGYDHTRDSALITGIYLASEALRYMATDAPDAADQIEETVAVLDRWWRISGDQGYLARFAAPTISPQATLDIFDSQDPEDHMNVSFESAAWHWKGDISRDQYQGVMLGYSLAYEATDDGDTKEIIRARVVSFVEQLMVDETVEIDIDIDGVGSWDEDMDLKHCVFTDDDGDLAIEIDLDDLEGTSLNGFLCFTPNFTDFLEEIDFLHNLPGGIPDIELPSQALQLAGMFRVALQVTDGVPAYATRRATILSHYNSYFWEWKDFADDWENTNECGDSYHGINTAFIPMWNWIRLESGMTRENLQLQVLRDQFWPAVEDHKNVMFAFMNAAEAHSSESQTGNIARHVGQLQLFPTAPNNQRYVNNYAIDAGAITHVCPLHSSFRFFRNHRKQIFALLKQPVAIQGPIIEKPKTQIARV